VILQLFAEDASQTCHAPRDGAESQVEALHMRRANARRVGIPADSNRLSAYEIRG
jgi:hypothetical protein